MYSLIRDVLFLLLFFGYMLLLTYASYKNAGLL